MKYDVLNSFRKYLNENIQNKNTADRYYFAVENVFKDMTFKGGEEIPRDNVEKILLAMKGKSNFSAAKNGLKHFANFDNGFDRPDDKFFNAIGLTKKNRSIKPNKTLNYDSITKKINAIDDKKLKEAYRLMMFAGLRVSEAAQLNKNDITFVDGETVKINVLHGKGGANGEVFSVKNKGFVQGLKQYLENCPDDKPFYAAKTMKNKAGKIDLECHDFRRIASQLHKNEALEDGCNAFDANDSTKEFLRHKRFSTTKRYLMNRKLEVKILTTPKNVTSPNLLYVGKINTSPLEKIFGKVKNSNIIITNERLSHIGEHHPDDLEYFKKYGQAVISSPDIIILDEKSRNTVFMVKKILDKNFNALVKIILDTDNTHYENSIITFYRIRDKNLQKLKARFSIIYKKE